MKPLYSALPFFNSLGQTQKDKILEKKLTILDDKNNNIKDIRFIYQKPVLS